MQTAKIIAEIEHAIDTDRDCPADAKRWLLALAQKVQEQELEGVSHDKPYAVHIPSLAGRAKPLASTRG